MNPLLDPKQNFLHKQELNTVETQTVYKLSLYGFMMFCCAMIMQAEQTFLPQGLTLFLAPLAFWLIEHKGWQGIPTVVSNILGVLAFGLVIAEFEGVLPSFFGLGVKETPDFQLVAGVNLLTYLSWVLLFMPKRPVYYWGMFVIGILQVGLSCILTNSNLFYFLLLVFSLFSMWTLTLHMIFLAREQLKRSNQEQFQSANAFIATNGNGSMAMAMVPQETTAPNISLLSGSSVMDSIYFGSNDRWITRRMVFGFLIAGTSSILMAAILFAFIPRMWFGGNRAGFFDERFNKMEAGFSDSINLGQFGKLLESSEPVMEVELIDLGGKKGNLFDYAESLGYQEPLFRGAVLTEYDSGQWQSGQPLQGFTPSSEFRYPTVQQKIKLFSSGSRHLFGMSPISYIAMEPGFENGLNRTSITEEWKIDQPVNSEVQYVVRSYIRNKKPLIPTGDIKGFIKGGQLDKTIFNRAHQELLQFPEEDLAPIAELAKQLAAEVTGAEVPFELGKHYAFRELSADSDIMKVARHFEKYFVDDNRYEYGLNLKREDESVDPLVDFVLNTKKGHCEFFASGMAMMCRSVGIPARVITGFKGGKYNSLTGKYHISQNNAHAWVEVVIGGVWYVFDPTPAEYVSQFDSDRGSQNQNTQYWEYITSRWRDLVVNMSSDRQNQLVYGPIYLKVMELWYTLKQQGWGEFWNKIWEIISNPKDWFSYTGLFTICLFIGLIWITRRFLRYLMKKFGFDNSWKKRQKSFLQLQIEFYKQYQKLCRSQGLERQLNQTQLEFASQVESSWFSRLDSSQMEHFPSQLTEVYNRIRFGDQAPNQQELDQLRAKLKEVEQVLRKSPAT